jgi:MtfA peptidase
MLRWLYNLYAQQASSARWAKRSGSIPNSMWMETIARFPFLVRPLIAEQLALREMTEQFLRQKQFTGAGGLIMDDHIAVAIAAQACLPVVHLGLQFYDDFKGIVVHPGPMLARREVTDEHGLVHRYSEELTGEAMQGGPVTLSWADVVASGESAKAGYNVVIHEFVHKIDMRDGVADGCPPLPTMAARHAWQEVLEPAYDLFCEKVAMAQRFGGPPTWLDSYAAKSPAEFFAVACEGFFVNRERFSQDFPQLAPLFSRFFRTNEASASRQ